MAFDASGLFWSVGICTRSTRLQSAKFYGIPKLILSAGGELISYNLQLKNNLIFFEYSRFWRV